MVGDFFLCVCVCFVDFFHAFLLFLLFAFAFFVHLDCDKLRNRILKSYSLSFRHMSSSRNKVC